ncbi:MAG: Uma2 family endonuclease [Phormidesmis sp.]
MVATPTRISPRTRSKLDIVWEKLPSDFILPDDPVDNINQPPLASALTDSLALAGYLSPSAFTASNYGICTRLDGKTVVKAPDWVWVPTTKVPRKEIERSYTPHLEGDIPLVVMEFLSYTEGGEYSIKSSYPPGKWFYYEQVLQVPYYAIFQPDEGTIEAFSLAERGTYEPIEPNPDGRYWLADVSLFLGLWEGTRQTRTGYWLRWWDADGQMLSWGEELAEQERQKAEQERQKAEQIQRKAIAKLIDLGLSAEAIADTLNLSVEDVRRSQS